MDLKDLQKYIKMESVSTDPKYEGEVVKTAKWLSKYLGNLGMDSRLIEKEGYPIVYGELITDKAKPTVLVYGHYDVQPVEPVVDWSVEPFGAHIKDGAIWGRGASDNKGQFWCHVLAIAEYKKKGKQIPINLKFFLEGEEEVGSIYLESFIKKNKDLLACDVAWISDGSATDNGAPTIEAGLRGSLNCSVKVSGPKTDLHAGVYGGSIANPASVLAGVIVGLVDKDGKITIKGFYDGVAEISDVQRAVIANAPFNEKEYLDNIGSLRVVGEKGYTTQERVGLRPAIEVSGLKAGYADGGFKNIIPADATANLNFRFVKGQGWRKVREMVREYFKLNMPDSVSYEIKFHGGNDAYMADVSADVITSAADVFSEAFGKKTIIRFEGASLPVANYFADYVTENVLLSGWAQEMHVPDEKLDLELIEKGTKAVRAYWEKMSKNN